jgi:hypothetical protein
MTALQIEKLIVATLNQRPSTAKELAIRLGVNAADIHTALWFLVFADRSVTCAPDGRFRLGSPPGEWPQLSRVHR